jgi:dephospho-CoA kinase
MIIGLTGGIGSGKSSAADFFQNEGISVIDTDQLARKVIEKDTPGYSKVVDSFGANILDNNDSIDRAKLREAVFHDSEKRKILESITHPLVRELMVQKISSSTSPYSIIMVPLIFETNSAKNYDRVLVIDCDVEIQLERAMARDENSADLIQKIIDSQCSRSERLSIANDVIPNNHSIEDLKKRSLAMHKFYLGFCSS